MDANNLNSHETLAWNWGRERGFSNRELLRSLREARHASVERLLGCLLREDIANLRSKSQTYSTDEWRKDIASAPGTQTIIFPDDTRCIVEIRLSHAISVVIP